MDSKLKACEAVDDPMPPIFAASSREARSSTAAMPKAGALGRIFVRWAQPPKLAAHGCVT
jgi:hypothetical protein